MDLTPKTPQDVQHVVDTAMSQIPYIYIPIFRSHIIIPKFPIYSHILDTNSIHAEHGWSVRLKKPWAKWPSCVLGWPGKSNSFPDPIIQDVLHVISMDDRMIGWRFYNLWWSSIMISICKEQWPPCGSLNFPKSERSENFSHVLLSHFVHFCPSYLNVEPSPGSRQRHQLQRPCVGGWCVAQRAQRVARGGRDRLTAGIMEIMEWMSLRLDVWWCLYWLFNGKVPPSQQRLGKWYWMVYQTGPLFQQKGQCCLFVAFIIPCLYDQWLIQAIYTN
jgi:hypothetical protein